MKIIRKVYNISTVLLYLCMTLVWLMLYIFMGEDIDLNTTEEYISFIKFTCIYLLLVMMYFMKGKQHTVKAVILAIGMALTPILIAGYMGARGHIEKDIALLTSRKLVLLIHILTYGIGFVKTYKHYEKELWAKT